MRDAAVSVGELVGSELPAAVSELDSVAAGVTEGVSVAIAVTADVSLLVLPLVAPAVTLLEAVFSAVTEPLADTLDDGECELLPVAVNELLPDTVTAAERDALLLPVTLGDAVSLPEPVGVLAAEVVGEGVVEAVPVSLPVLVGVLVRVASAVTLLVRVELTLADTEGVPAGGSAQQAST